MKRALLSFTTIMAMAVPAIAISSYSAYAGEDSKIVYTKTDGRIDTAVDTSSDGYMRAGTKLVVNCTGSGCVETPAPNFVATGPVARDDVYSISVNQGMNVISESGLDGSYKTNKTDGKTERIITLRLPVMSNDSAGPDGPISMTSVNINNVTVPVGSPAPTIQMVGDKIEIVMTFNHDIQIANWDFKIMLSYTIKDTKGKTSNAKVDFSLNVMFSPLAVDLDGDGIELVPLSQGVPFDIDMDGTLDKISWVHKDDALLAMDRNGDGIINHRKELFGNLPDEGIANGFDSLLRYDDNNDFIFDKNDKEFSKVLVWQDLNQDGIGAPTELKSLSAHNIESISLNAVNTGFNVGENVITHESYFLKSDGTKSQIVDAWFMQTLGVPPPKLKSQAVKQ